MLKPFDPFADEPVPPQCRATTDRLQRALDGEDAVESLDADPHLGACPACRERVRAARVLLAVLATPAKPVAVSAGFTDRVVKAVQEDRHVRTRRGVYKAAAWFALAAAVLVAAFAIFAPKGEKPVNFVPDIPHEVARKPEVAPPPEKVPAPTPAPEPRPIRFNDEFAKAGQAFRDAPNPLAESVAVAPKVFDALTSPFTQPPAPMGMGEALEPARKSLADLPDAARTGLEPVTDTAQKAYDRFLRDFASVKPKS